MRPEHWMFTIPLRLRSLFHFAGRKRTKNWTTSCATTPNEKSRNAWRKGWVSVLSAI
jgi:hypothetical protein